MLSRLRKRLFGGAEETQDGNARTMNFAFVLLSEPKLPDADAIARSFASLTNNRQTLRSTASDQEVYREVLQLELDAHNTVTIMLMPIAVPNREADEAANFSLSSFGTGWTLPEHNAHLLVTLQSSTTRLESLLTFTSLLAAVAEASSAVGIYWGNAGATHDPKFFVEMARDLEVESGIMLWNGVSRAKEPDGRLSLLSLGMKQLDLPDLWLIAPPESEPAEWFFNLLSYVATRGEAIPDGDTIGPSAEQRIAVRYVPSPIDETVQVWRVELD